VEEDVETTVVLENGPCDLVSTLRGTDIGSNEEIQSVAVRPFGSLCVLNIRPS
jgi:hypothetical protein